ncbi:MAG: tRNA (adenosine(37)-N6)-threonylcarbamoyltransferase complex dimerization subunit type 1 TsaB [Solirubrobacterales bacterium]
MILGFDTATPETTVAVVHRGEVLFEAAAGPGPDGRPVAGTALLAMVDEAASAAGGWDRIATIAVGRGSFTGLRIAISTARAISQARRIPVAGVDSTAALAAELRERAGEGRPVVGIVDARRGRCSPPPTSAWVPASRSSAPCGRRIRASATASASPWPAGTRPMRFRTEIEAIGFEVDDEDPANRLSARQICLLAAKMEPGGARYPAGVTPKYMRRPDAERWLERNGTRSRDHRPRRVPSAG